MPAKQKISTVLQMQQLSGVNDFTTKKLPSITAGRICFVIISQLRLWWILFFRDILLIVTLSKEKGTCEDIRTQKINEGKCNNSRIYIRIVFEDPLIQKYQNTADGTEDQTSLHFHIKHLTFQYILLYTVTVYHALFALERRKGEFFCFPYK